MADILKPTEACKLKLGSRYLSAVQRDRASIAMFSGHDPRAYSHRYREARLRPLGDYLLGARSRPVRFPMKGLVATSHERRLAPLTANLLSSPQSLLKYSLRLQSTISCTQMLWPLLSLMVRSDHFGLLYQLHDVISCLSHKT